MYSFKINLAQELVDDWREWNRRHMALYVEDGYKCATLAFFRLYCFYCPLLRLPGICQTPLMFFFILYYDVISVLA